VFCCETCSYVIDRHGARRISFQCVIGGPYLFMKPTLDGAIACKQRS
jgi:hypothetical protein